MFDGGYAFGRVAGQAELPMVIGAEGKGTYIVEAVAPPGYLHQGNGDKNVTFGDELKASTAALPHECVGMELRCAGESSRCSRARPNPNYGSRSRQQWRKCDMKAVPLLPGTNAAPNFFMFTEAPVAGHGVGFILDDTATEFNYLAPNFGEKYSPPHLPVSIQDWTGREISRVYSDQFGSYNFLVPSSFTINPPYPSGVMPSMMVACMNHPGPITIGANPDALATKLGIDPYFNRNYTTVLLHVPVPGRQDDLPRHAGAADRRRSPRSRRTRSIASATNGTPAIYSVNNGTTTVRGCPPAGGHADHRVAGSGRRGQPGVRSGVVLGRAADPPPLDPTARRRR